jgi:pentatricopeptide repeat protein
VELIQQPVSLLPQIRHCYSLSICILRVQCLCSNGDIRFNDVRRLMSLLFTLSHSSGLRLSKIAPRQAVLSFLYPVSSRREAHTLSKGRNRRQDKAQIVSTTTGLEAWFIDSLASAGNCRKHSTRSTQDRLPLQRPYLPTKSRQISSLDFLRYEHAESKSLQEFAFPENRTREELFELVDQYSGNSYTDQLPLIDSPKLYQPSDGPHLTVSDKPEDEWPLPHHAWPADEATKIKLRDLRLALQDYSKDPQEIYRLYRALPEPRAPYLESRIRHKMLRRLSVVERKDEHSMLRYLSVVDDMKGSAIPLSSAEWTSAVSFAARYVPRSTEVEVEAALHMWREMEHVAGVRGHDATFNVLFDVACKAGKFVLAEMIYKEMEARGFEFNRYHHVSMIFYYGLQKNGDGARAAYKALVEAGEMVDTVVLNAMISALIRAHEPIAAENVYERMKKAHFERSGSKLQPRGFRDRRAITRILKEWALMAKAHPEMKQELQSRSIIAPDLDTFRILINYFAVEAGELDKTARFLEEMKWFHLPVHGALFNSLLKGFALHGGIRYTHWTENQLESVWRSLLEALDEGVEGIYLSKWMATWGLRAFAKCSGKSRTLVAWEELKGRWKPAEEDMSFVMSNLHRILQSADTAHTRQDWVIGEST